jgi:hypothetical protein
MVAGMKASLTRKKEEKNTPRPLARLGAKRQLQNANSKSARLRRRPLHEQSGIISRDGS